MRVRTTLSLAGAGIGALSLLVAAAKATPARSAETRAAARIVAGGQPGQPCSERTVEGSYAFALQGNVHGIGPIAVAGTTSFDGQGSTSIEGFVATTTGAPAIRAAISGSYTVEPDCTGSATYTVPAPGLFGFTQLRFDGVIVDNGEEIRYLITTPGITFAGATVRQHSKGRR
ncbi:MAG TPA: hypothetical protein VNI83_13720 [Vicinamibacterales bacterium]|nr:hypothetical protein [Vicinamibacterales bacterium]